MWVRQCLSRSFNYRNPIWDVTGPFRTMPQHNSDFSCFYLEKHSCSKSNYVGVVLQYLIWVVENRLRIGFSNPLRYIQNFIILRWKFAELFSRLILAIQISLFLISGLYRKHLITFNREFHCILQCIFNIEW